MRKIPEDTMYFTYRQVNPKNKNAGDCVVRALASAMGLEWETVYDALCELGRKYKLMPNDDRCFEKYLEQNGWVRRKQPRKFDNTKYTGKEFCDYLDETRKRNRTPIILSIGCQHLSSIEWNSVSGYTICDSWDCSDSCVGKYYERIV